MYVILILITHLLTDKPMPSCSFHSSAGNQYPRSYQGWEYIGTHPLGKSYLVVSYLVSKLVVRKVLSAAFTGKTYVSRILGCILVLPAQIPPVCGCATSSNVPLLKRVAAAAAAGVASHTSSHRRRGLLRTSMSPEHLHQVVFLSKNFPFEQELGRLQEAQEILT